jgi:dynein heavy chain
MFSALQDLLEEWFKYQKNWLYMEPLFTNNYFKYYAKELKAFTTADNTWRKIMMKQSKDFSARRWAEHETALQTLRTNNTQLEGLKKMIADFLLKKREAFNRWYFISDYQLIRTLSDFKDIKSLQPHLHTVF